MALRAWPRVAASAVVAAAVCGVPPALGASARSVPETALRSVVTIHVGNGQGSGFAFGEPGRIVTNAHVVGRARTVRVSAPGGRSAEGEVIAVDAAADLAVVRVDLKLPPLSARSGAPKRGEDVYAIGSPLGLEGSIAKGIVSAIRADGRLGEVIQSDVSVNPGNSGGPLIDARGAVLGVNTSKAAGGEGIAFAVPVARARSLLARRSTTPLRENERNGVAWPLAAVGAGVALIFGFGLGRTTRRRRRDAGPNVELRPHRVPDIWEPDERVALKTPNN